MQGNDWDRAEKITADVVKAEALKPTNADVASVATRTTYEADGTPVYHLEGKAAVAALDEMARPWRRAAADVGQKAHDGTPTTTISVCGVERVVPAGAERRLYAQGFRARIKGRRKRITSESEIRRRMEAGE